MDKWGRLYLVRHGHVDYFDAEHRPINPKYAELSAQGREQIAVLAQDMQQLPLDYVYSSSLIRATQTAAILVGQRMLPIQALPELCEIRSGRLRDIPYEQAEVLIKYAYAAAEHQLEQFMQGERWQDFQDRVLTALQQILVRHPEQQILIAAHDAVNRVIINWVYGQEQHQFYAQEQHYGCLNIIDYQIDAEHVSHSRLQLQNYTPYNIFKMDQQHSAMDEVYRMYQQANGFQELKT